MIPASPLSIKQSLNKAYRLIKPKRAGMEAFKANLIHLLQGIDEKESEENVKIQLMDLLKNTFYHPDYLVATKGKTDLVIHTSKEAKTPAGVLVEVKRATNKATETTAETLEEIKEDIEAKAYEFIKDKVSALNWEQMQELVAGILRGRGYKTLISP